MRAVLTSLLVVEMLLGPGMCCCFASRLAAPLVPTPAAPESKTPAAQHACCQAKRKKEPTPARQAPASPCPCQEERDQAPGKVPARLNLDDATAVWRNLSGGPEAVLVPAAAVLPFPSCRDLSASAHCS